MHRQPPTRPRAAIRPAADSQPGRAVCRLPAGLLVALCAAAIAAQAACSGSGACSGGSGSLTGQIIDAPTSTPLPLALIALQTGSLDPPYTDLAKADPSYTLGQQANYHGNFTVKLPCGNYGLHTYMPGYYALGVEVPNGPAAKVALQPLDPNVKALPTVGTPQTSPASIRPNTSVTLEVPVQAVNASDPLTGEVLLLIPSINRAMALAPPSAGSADGFPDGTWRATFLAPSPGTYACTVLAVSHAGVTGLTTFSLSVTL